MALDKYLESYAEPETQKLNEFPFQFQHVLVIPCHEEPLESVQNLLQLPKSSGNVLTVLVINRPDLKTDSVGNNRDQRLWNTLSEQLPILWSSDKETVLYELPSNGNALLVIDRFSKGRQIPAAQGVGLARKIGADIACKLICDQKIAGHWIHSTDADVELPANYFRSVDSYSGSSALIYPFQHRCSDNSLQQPIELYEFKLRYYVAALQWSGSNYAFHTIGSLLCIDANSYAKVRGFPKLSGAEDFYLLNKLAKVGKIQSLETPTVLIEARLSERVPFGTGPALISIQALENPGETYRFYNPKSFTDLAVWHSLMGSIWNQRHQYQQRGLRHILLAELNAEGGTTYSSHDDSIHQQAERLTDTLTSVKIELFLAHGFKQCRNQQAFQKQINDWFDGFKTLKFIHHMREHYFEDVRLQDLTETYSELTDQIIGPSFQTGFNLNQVLETMNHPIQHQQAHHGQKNL